MGVFNFRKSKPEFKQKRNFDNVSWKWVGTVNGVEVNPFHLFCFKNGLGVIVMKHSPETFDGMMCYAIKEFTKDFKFKRAVGLGVYDYAGGLDEEGVKLFCQNIKEIKT